MLATTVCFYFFVVSSSSSRREVGTIGERQIIASLILGKFDNICHILAMFCYAIMTYNSPATCKHFAIRHLLSIITCNLFDLCMHVFYMVLTNRCGGLASPDCFFLRVDLCGINKGLVTFHRKSV